VKIAPLLILLAYLATGSAAAQYRAGGPEVLTPAPESGSPLMMAAHRFRAGYARHGSPRIILFWNRVLSDEVESQYANHVSAVSTSRAGAVEGPVGYAGYGAAAGRVDTLDIAATKARIREGQRDSMAESADWKVETAFNRAFIDNGARFVDRSVAMRITAHGRKLGATPNVQDIETGALVGKADLMMEVLQTPDPESPVGYSFRAQVKDVRSGRILVSAIGNGSDLARGPGPMVATAHGFVRTAPPAVTLEDVGEALAADVMGALAARWS
jgi:hypothetical protein